MMRRWFVVFIVILGVIAGYAIRPYCPISSTFDTNHFSGAGAAGAQARRADGPAG